jgi:hypothetical protein
MKVNKLNLIGAFLLLSLVAKAQAVFTTNGASVNYTAAGPWSISGIDFGSNGIPDGTDQIVVATGHTLNINFTAAAITVGKVTVTGGTIDFSTNNKALTISDSLTFRNTCSIIGGNNNRVLNLQGHFFLRPSASLAFGGIQVNQTATQNWVISGAFTPSSNTGVKTIANVIVNNGGSWNATSGETFTTQNFTIFEGGLLDGNSTSSINIGGNLTVEPSTPSGSHAQVGRINVTVTGTTLVKGYWEFTFSNTGTKTFNNTITVNAGATWDNLIGEDPRVNCSIVNNGLWPIPTGGNGRYDVFTAGTYTYSGTNVIGMTRLYLRNPGVQVTNLGQLRLTKAGNDGLTLQNGSTYINGAGSHLFLTSETDPVTIIGAGNVVNFSTANNTVEYEYAGNQTIYSDTGTPTVYDRLICSNGGTKTIDTDVVVNTSLTISGSTIVDQNSGFNLTGTGNLIMTGSSRFRVAQSGTVPSLTGTTHTLASGTVVEFYRNGAQTAAASNPASGGYPYRKIEVTQGSVLNLGSVTNIAEDLDVRNTATLSNASILGLTIGGEWDYGSTGATSFATGSTITASTFLLSSGTITAGNLVLTINGNNGQFNHNGGTFTANTSTIAFTTGTNQSITGSATTSLANILINNTNNVTLLKNVSYNTVLTFNASTANIVTGSFTLTCSATSTGVTRVSSTTSGFVEGNFSKALAAGSVTRIYEVGTGTTYAPVTMVFTGNSTGSFIVSSTSGDHPDIFSSLIRSTRSANRYWTLRNNAVTFTSVNLTFQYATADLDNAADASSVIVKNLNTSTLLWNRPTQGTISAGPPPTAQVTGLTTATTGLPSAVNVDFQIGIEIDPAEVFNRVTGSANWSSAATWIQIRSGNIILSTSGSNNISGSATKFTTELVVGDQIMLTNALGTVYTVTDIASDILLTVTPAPSSASTPTAYGRQYVPTANIDAVFIGNLDLPDVATTITYDMPGITNIFSLDIGLGRTQRHQLTHSSATNLKMDATAFIYQNIADNTGNPHSWNINNGSAEVLGTISIGGTTTGGGSPINDADRIARVQINNGTLTANSISFRTNGAIQAAILDCSGGDGLINLSGSFNFSIGSVRGTFTPKTTGTGSTINFNGTNTQTISFPTTTSTTFDYHNIRCNNASSGGLTIVNNLTDGGANSVSGNLSVESGILRIPGNNTIVGGTTKTFTIAPGATFRMEGSQGFPTSFATYTLGATAPFGTVEYQNTASVTVPDLPGTDSYGILNFRPTATATYTLPNTTVNVAGSMTIGNATNASRLNGGGTSTVLAITDDLTIATGSRLDASNFVTGADGVSVGGNWTNNGTFTQDDSRVRFFKSGVSAIQTIGGVSTDTFYDLNINTGDNTGIVQMQKSFTVSNSLLLNRGGLELNGNTLSITNSLSSAIVRTSPSYIRAEKTTAPYGEVSWQQQLATAGTAFVYPFGKSATEYIPFTFTVTTAATGGVSPRTVSLSTYGTAADNMPFMSPVVNFNGATDGISVVDRYWTITLNNYTGTRPTATLDFVATDAEIATTGLDSEASSSFSGGSTSTLAAQRWSPSNYWDAAVGSPSQTYTPNTPASNTGRVRITGVSSFSPWVLVDQSAPLPVELVDFSARLIGGSVQLDWVTASELNNDYFTVERTVDAEQFEEVALVGGAGTTNKKNTYSAFDSSPVVGKNYYRIKQVDFDGTFSYSKLITVEVSDVDVWSVYPNPYENTNELLLTVSSLELSKVAFVELRDIQGKIVYNTKIPSIETRALKLTPPQLSAGMYLLTVTIDGKRKNIRVVVK